MHLTRQMTAVIATSVLLTFAAACDLDDSQILTDTTAAGSSGGGSAASEQLEATPGRIERAFAGDSALRGLGLEAEEEEKENRILLEGTVPSEEHKARAMQIATREAGGIQIENRIRVEARQ
jgi:hypothetical protein